MSAQMMQPLFPGHVPMTDIELFELFNVELCDENGVSLGIGDMWHVMPIWGKDSIVDNPAASRTIEDTDKAKRIALYRSRVEANLPIFQDNE